MSVQLKSSKQGFVLVVNGLYISVDLSCRSEIKAITCEFGIPYGTTQWVSVADLRYFWNMYREEIVAATRRAHYKSVWGQLHPVERPSQDPELTHNNTISYPAQLWVDAQKNLWDCITPEGMLENFKIMQTVLVSAKGDHFGYLNISL